MRYWSLSTGLWTDDINKEDKWKASVIGGATGRVIVITAKYKSAINKELFRFSDVIYKAKKI